MTKGSGRMEGIQEAKQKMNGTVTVHHAHTVIVADIETEKLKGVMEGVLETRRKESIGSVVATTEEKK